MAGQVLLPRHRLVSNLIRVDNNYYRALVCCFAWLVIVVLTVHGQSRQRSLLGTNNTASDAPLVSILVPARNEQHRVLEHCIHSILAQDYGRFEVIAVNDRSTDETGAILARLAKSDERLRVIEGEELPPDGSVNLTLCSKH